MATDHRLKPCPFCGSENVSLVTTPDGYIVDCWNCDARVSFGVDSPAQTVTSWNQRHCSETPKEEYTRVWSYIIQIQLAAHLSGLRDGFERAAACLRTEAERVYTEIGYEQGHAIERAIAAIEDMAGEAKDGYDNEMHDKSVAAWRAIWRILRDR